MSAASEFFCEMIGLYLISLLGFYVRRKGILNEHANDVLTHLLLFVTLPALILFSLDINFSLSLIKEFIWLLAMSLYILTFSILLANWMRKRSTLLSSKRTVYESLIIFGNQGFIGYAVSFILFQEQGIVYLTIFNVFYLMLIWTYGIYLFTKNKQSIEWKLIFLNPGILSTMIGLIILLTPITFPIIISNVLESIGKMTIPLSMMVIGSLIAEIEFKRFTTFFKNQYLWKVAATRLLIIPCLLFPFIIFQLPFPVLVVAILVSGMPAASTISLYAKKYGGDSQFASFGVLLTTIFCIISIPLLYLLITILY